MPPPELPALLSLAGHELRGALGVLGGYVRLLARDRETLTARQRQTVDAANRAVTRMVETLDELREVQRWLLPDRPTPPVSAAVDLRELLAEATAGVPEGVAVQLHPSAAPAPWRGDVAAMARAFAACLEAIAREHLPPVTVRLTLAIEGRRAIVRLAAAGGLDASYERRPFDNRRSGLGLRLVLATAVVEAAGGALHDLALDGAAAGIEVELPLYSQ